MEAACYRFIHSLPNYSWFRMGIRFACPNGHRLHVKAYLAGQRGICPDCGVRVHIPYGKGPTGKGPSGKGPSEGQSSAPGSQAADSPAVSSAAESVSSILQQASPARGPGRSKQDRDETANPSPAAQPLNVGPSIDLVGGGSSSDSIVIQTVPEAKTTTPIPPSPPTNPGAAGQTSSDTASRNTISDNAVPGNTVSRNPVPGSTAKSAWYVRPPGGGQFGPADTQTFSRWMHEKRVVADSYVWCDGWPDWQRAGDIADQLPGPPSRLGGVGGDTAPVADGSMPVVDTSVDNKAMESTAVNTLRKSRQRTQRFQITVAVVLLIAVLALLGVLIHVMTYTPPPKSHPGGAVQIDFLEMPASDCFCVAWAPPTNSRWCYINRLRGRSPIYESASIENG